MRLKELLNRVTELHAEYGDDLLVTDGRGLSVNFFDVIGVPVQGQPKPTEEQLNDPNFTRQYNDVLMISSVTSTEIKADAVNQHSSFEYWMIEFKKVNELADFPAGMYDDLGDPAIREKYYDKGFSPAEAVAEFVTFDEAIEEVSSEDIAHEMDKDWNTGDTNTPAADLIEIP